MKSMYAHFAIRSKFFAILNEMENTLFGEHIKVFPSPLKCKVPTAYHKNSNSDVNLNPLFGSELLGVATWYNI